MVAKKAIDAVSLKANAVLTQCAAAAIALMQGLIDSSKEVITLKDQIEQASADLSQCQDFGFTAVRDMFIGQSDGEKFSPMSFELIYDLYDVMSQGAAKSNVLKSAKSALQTAHTFGLTITPTTSKGECLAHIKKHKKADRARAETSTGETSTGNNGETGELPDAAVILQAFALLFVDKGLRQANAEKIARLSQMLVADRAQKSAPETKPAKKSA